MRYLLLLGLLFSLNVFAQSFKLENMYGACETHKLKSGICLLVCTGDGNGTGAGIIKVNPEDCN